MTHGFVLIVKNANNPEVYRVEVPPVTPVSTLNVVCCSLVHTRLTHTNTELPLTPLWTTPRLVLFSAPLSLPGVLVVACCGKVISISSTRPSLSCPGPEAQAAG